MCFSSFDHVSFIYRQFFFETLPSILFYYLEQTKVGLTFEPYENNVVQRQITTCCSFIDLGVLFACLKIKTDSRLFTELGFYNTVSLV